MTSRWLTMIYFGLAIRHVDASTCTGDVQEKCSQTLLDYMKPVNLLFDKLYKVMEQNQRSPESQIVSPDVTSDRCVPFIDVGYFKLGNCYTGLLGTFDVKMTPLKTDKGFLLILKLKPAEINADKENIKALCGTMYSSLTKSYPHMCAKCEAPVTVVTNSCTTVEPKTPGDAKSLKESHIIIASVSSFLGGVLSTLLVLCACKLISKRKANDSLGQDAAALQFEVLEERKNNLHADHKTYETLTTKDALAGQPPSDQVYLGLDSNLESSKFADTKTVEANVMQAKTNGSLIRSQIHEQTDASAAEIHVYNVVGSEGTSNLYEDTKAKEMAEHTYTGLGTRDNTDQSMTPGSRILVPELQNDQPGEDHDYFLLENDTTRQTTDKGTVETHQIECQVTETKEDDHSAIGHDYFTLEKGENSGPSIHESGENVRVSETESFHDGHDYFNLEKV